MEATAMQPGRFFEQFTQQFNSAFGANAGAVSEELRQQIRTAMAAAFNKLELVPREEFDAQQAVLQRTRQRLEALEQQVTELEAQINK